QFAAGGVQPPADGVAVAAALDEVDDVAGVFTHDAEQGSAAEVVVHASQTGSDQVDLVDDLAAQWGGTGPGYVVGGMGDEPLQRGRGDRRAEQREEYPSVHEDRVRDDPL